MLTVGNLTSGILKQKTVHDIISSTNYKLMVIFMRISELKATYKNLLQPVFGEQFRMDDSEEDRDWVVIILDGEQENFYFSIYGVNCVHLYWCNECFVFDKNRNALVSSDTYGEIVFEDQFDIEQLPPLISGLILQLKDCTYVAKKETVKGKIPSGYDDIKDYVIIAQTETTGKSPYQLGNITVEYV